MTTDWKDDRAAAPWAIWDSLVPHSVMQSQIDAAVAAEREACAKIAEAAHWTISEPYDFPEKIAAAIRARGKQC